MTKLNVFALLWLALTTSGAGYSQSPPPKLTTQEWHWTDPQARQHAISIKDLGQGVFTFTDQEKQTGTAFWDPQANRFDIKDGKLAGEAWITKDNKIVLRTKTGSLATYHEGAPVNPAPAPARRASRLDGESPGSFR